MKIVFHLLLSLFCCLSFALSAQVKVQVVTRQIEKRFDYKEGLQLNIEGQRAEVKLETWEEKEISVVLQLTLKHPSKDTAMLEMESIKYLAEQVKNNIYLRNYLSLPAGKELRSKFEAEYLIKLPKDCPVYVKNHFGNIDISNLSNQVKINSQFSTIGLTNLSDLIDIRTRFGDLFADQLDGVVAVNARRSNVDLRNIKGRYDLNIYYGMLNVLADKDLLEMNINAEKSEVFLFSPNPEIFAYNIESKYGALDLPNELQFKVKENDLALKKTSYQPNQELSANITITISFGDLHVDKKPKKVNP